MSARQCATVTLAALLSACAVPESRQQRPAMNVASSPDLVCFFEAPTGTNLKIRRCMSKEEYSKATETAQRVADEIRTPPPLPN